MNFSGILKVLPFMIVFSCGVCMAQSNSEGVGSISFHSMAISTADFENSGGSDSGAGMGSISAGMSMSFYGVNLDYTHTSFDWDKPGRIPFGNGKDEPWEALHSISIGYDFSDMFSETWGYFAYAGASSEFEEETEDSWGAMGFAGVIYNIPDWNLMIRIGGGASWNELETGFIPIAGIDWNAGAESGFAFSLGIPETQLSYRFNPKAALALSLGFGNGGVYRLADDSTASPGGYLEMESLGVNASFTFKPLEYCSITLGGGISTDNTLTIYDRNGKNGKEYDLDDAGGGFATVSFQF